MAFSFNGGNKGGKSFDPTQGFQMSDTQPQNHSDGGFSGFSFNDPETGVTSSTDLINHYDGTGIEDSRFKGIKRRGGAMPNFLNARLLIILGVVLACVILIAVFWEEILQVLVSIGVILILLAVFMIIVRIIFPRRRR